MPISGWIRDALGISKDVVDTKKMRLEIKKLEDEERTTLITPATLDDVKKYDPKRQALLKRLEEDADGGGSAFFRLAVYCIFYPLMYFPSWLLALLIVLFLILFVVIIKTLLRLF